MYLASFPQIVCCGVKKNCVNKPQADFACRPSIPQLLSMDFTDPQKLICVGLWCGRCSSNRFKGWVQLLYSSRISFTL